MAVGGPLEAWVLSPKLGPLWMFDELEMPRQRD